MTGDFWRAGHLPSLLCGLLHYTVGFMNWVLLGNLAPAIQQELGLSTTQTAMMVAMPLLGGAVFRILMGAVTDWLGPRRTGLIGIALTGLPLVWGWTWAQSYAALLTLGFLLGVAGASFAVALPLAGQWYPPRYQGLVLGIAGAGNLGTVIASLSAPRLEPFLGWHGVMGVALVPLGLFFAAFWLLARDAAGRVPKPISWRAYSLVLRRKETLQFSLLYSVTFGGFSGLASYLVIFFTDQYQLDPVVAGVFTALCTLSAAALRPVGGFLADRLGGVAVLRSLYIGIGTSMAAVALLPSLGTAVTLLVMGLAALGMGNGAVFQLVPQRFPQEVGLLSGIVGAAGGVGGYLLPFLLGSLRDLTGTYAWGFVVFAAAALSMLKVLAAVQRLAVPPENALFVSTLRD